MKRAEFIEAYNKLTDEQKKDYESMGYYCASTGEHYGKIASRCLYLAGALGGYYVPMSWLLKQKKYDFKGAKVRCIRFTIMKDADIGGKEFWGYGCWRIVNIADIRKANGDALPIEEVQEAMKQKELVTA